MKKTLSYRTLDSDTINFRALEEDGSRLFVGYASLFNVRSKLIIENGRSFYEVIRAGAFDEILATNPDVRLNYNHQRTALLARTKSKTLNLSVDETGLLFRGSVPNTTLGNDLYEMVGRQDIFECSFAFGVRKGDDEWSVDTEGNEIRTINKISFLYDVSLVVDGAYANTTVSAREDNRAITITIEIEEEDPETEPEEPEVEDPSTGEPGSEEAAEDLDPSTGLEMNSHEIDDMIIRLRMLKLKNN